MYIRRSKSTDNNLLLLLLLFIILHYVRLIEPMRND